MVFINHYYQATLSIKHHGFKPPDLHLQAFRPGTQDGMLRPILRRGRQGFAQMDHGGGGGEQGWLSMVDPAVNNGL